MDEDCALGAPRRGFAPSGLRRLTPGLMQAARTAERFDGLPEGVSGPGQLLAAFKAAAPRLGLSPRLVHAVDWLFRFTQPQDWERGGGHPVVWPSASMQQSELGLSETQTKELNRRLGEAGLITMRDSPTGKRYGRRDERGHIIEAYGFDLAPIAARHAEFRQLAEEGRAERLAIGRLRRRATIARKGIAQILETAAEYGHDGAEWSILAEETGGIARALREAEAPPDIEAGVLSLERRQSAAKSRLEALLRLVDSDPSGPESRPHHYTYNRTPDPSQDTVIARRDRSGGAAPSVPFSPGPVPAEGEKVLHLHPEDLVTLAPRLKPFLRSSDPTWPEIVDAADWLRRDLDVSKPLWGEACRELGRVPAAIAVAIVSTKEEGYFRTSSGGYFHGMVEKAKRGELHLERTLWGLRRGAQPAGSPPAERDGVPRRGESQGPWS